MKPALVSTIVVCTLAIGSLAAAQQIETFRWQGRVDGVDDILIRGSQVTVQHVSAKPIQSQDHRFSAPLPFAEVDIELEVLRGRGTVRLMEQPSYRNKFTAVVRVDDQDNSGDDQYEFQLSWSREDSRDSDVYEAVFRWKGRVDIGCEIEIQGRRHQVKDAGGSGTREKSANFTAPLPSSEVPVSVDKLHGRGRVELVQTPSSSNGFTAVVRIDDNKSGSDDYEFELRWPRE